MSVHVNVFAREQTHALAFELDGASLQRSNPSRLELVHLFDVAVGIADTFDEAVELRLCLLRAQA